MGSAGPVGGHCARAGPLAALPLVTVSSPSVMATVHGRCRSLMSPADRNRSGSATSIDAQAAATSGLRSTSRLVSARPSGPAHFPRATATRRRLGN